MANIEVSCSNTSALKGKRV